MYVYVCAHVKCMRTDYETLKKNNYDNIEVGRRWLALDSVLATKTPECIDFSRSSSSWILTRRKQEEIKIVFTNLDYTYLLPTYWRMWSGIGEKHNAHFRIRRVLANEIHIGKWIGSVFRLPLEDLVGAEVFFLGCTSSVDKLVELLNFLLCMLHRDICKKDRQWKYVSTSYIR